MYCAAVSHRQYKHSSGGSRRGHSGVWRGCGWRLPPTKELRRAGSDLWGEASIQLYYQYMYSYVSYVSVLCLPHIYRLSQQHTYCNHEKWYSLQYNAVLFNVDCCLAPCPAITWWV